MALLTLAENGAPPWGVSEKTARVIARGTSGRACLESATDTPRMLLRLSRPGLRLHSRSLPRSGPLVRNA